MSWYDNNLQLQANVVGLVFVLSHPWTNPFPPGKPHIRVQFPNNSPIRDYKIK